MSIDSRQYILIIRFIIYVHFVLVSKEAYTCLAVLTFIYLIER